MKIDFKPTLTTQKQILITKIKKLVSKLKPLPKDTFEKELSETSGKKIIVSRKHPNWCDAPEDGYRNNTVAERICYYQEDLKKMELMTEEEAMSFKRNLYKSGNYYCTESTVSLKDLEEFLQSCGKKLEDVLVKDNK